jgi:Ni,Fe-hydrogenase III large subunit
MRAAMAEIERIANHLNDWGFICNDAAFPAVHARTGVLREALLRACHVAFGHRLMMDRVLPGGVATDIAAGGLGLIADALASIEAELPALERITASHASLQDRLVSTGIIAPGLAALLNAGGVVGRASGRAVDARAVPGYAPYDELEVVPITRTEGDVAARLAVRQGEIRESLRMLHIIAAGMPEGEIMTALPGRAGEGFALVEGFRGECFCWLRLDDGGLIQAAFLRDPSWLHWPLLEAAVQGNIVADFPLINKSINGSYSGVDL